MHDTHHPVRDTKEPREPQASADPRRWKALAALGGRLADVFGARPAMLTGPSVRRRG